MSLGEIGFPRLDYFEVTSTLDIAREQVQRGAPHGTLITAIHQTAGRGRRGATWHDSGDSGVAEDAESLKGVAAAGKTSNSANALTTYLLRPGAHELPIQDAWRLPFLASLACVEALRGLGFDDARVKWPNDLVISGKKVGGLLVESVISEPSGERVYLLGIGINVGQVLFPAATRYALEPTSLSLESAKQSSAPNAAQVILALSASLDSAWHNYLADSEALIAAWRSYQTTGQTQTGLNSATGQEMSGRYVDVRSSDGAALIAVADGNAESLTAVIASS